MENQKTYYATVPLKGPSDGIRLFWNSYYILYYIYICILYKPNLQQWSRQGLVCLFVRFLGLIKIRYKKNNYSIYTTVCTYVAAKPNKRVKMKKDQRWCIMQQKNVWCAGVKSYEMLRRWVMWVYIPPPGACVYPPFSPTKTTTKRNCCLTPRDLFRLRHAEIDALGALLILQHARGKVSIDPFLTFTGRIWPLFKSFLKGTKAWEFCCPQFEFFTSNQIFLILPLLGRYNDSA
jgi:hypothetical protein